MKAVHLLLVLLLLSCSCASAPAQSGSDSGTSSAELAALKLPAPETVKIGVLPFWTPSGDVQHPRIIAAALWKRFERESFVMAPLDQSFRVFSEDPYKEAGVPIRVGDALRIARTLEVDWIVWGETEPAKRASTGSWLQNGRMWMARVRDNSVFYTRSREERVVGLPAGIEYRGYQLPRATALAWSENALSPLFSALPEHEVKGPRLTDESLEEFLQRTFPDTPRD